MWRIIVCGHRSASSTTYRAADNCTIATTHLIADRSASSTTDTTTNGGVQGGTIRTHISSGHQCRRENKITYIHGK
jgi:hypothetical protein